MSARGAFDPSIAVSHPFRRIALRRPSQRIAVLLTLLAVTLQGCIIVRDGDGDIPPAPSYIELINLTGLVIDANFFISGSATDEVGLFVRENIYTAYSTHVIPTLGAHETAAFFLECDATRSIGVRRPVFQNLFTLTGGESSDVIFLLRARDFSCGERLRFVYFAEGDQYHVRLERPQ
ncbi:MAG: hypothetical protein CHACPFDD_01680 [Phycisphaerae bacterium]|nr:hypothetical protein [Phycisphaerae bacterium]